MTLISRVVGPHPGRGAPQLEWLRWVHRLWFRGTAPILLVLCVALVAMGVWLVASILAAVMVWFLVSLSLRLRRDERKVRDAPKGV
jgi:hypothetical protein